MLIQRETNTNEGTTSLSYLYIPYFFSPQIAHKNMTNNTDAATALKQTLERLDVQRKSLEMEGEAIISELTFKPENGGAPMGIETPLVDQDGYPRADIDVYRARELRNRLAIIKTDIKSLSSQIEQSLRQLALLQVRTNSAGHLLSAVVV